MLLLLTPCRLSFALCALLALLVDPEHGSHVTVADPPFVRGFASFQKELMT